MKKLKLSLLAILAGLTIVGCGSSTTNDPIDIHYLTDFDGYGVPGVPYTCGTIPGEQRVGVTDRDGAYIFNPYDYECSFDLTGLVRDLYIYDEIGPINGLGYECVPSGFFGYTGEPPYADGFFDYDTDDTCVIGDFLI